MKLALASIVVDGTAESVDLDPDRHRFEINVGPYSAFIDYRAKGSVLSLIHTEVPSELRGKGLADALARTALDYARSQKLTIKPYCPFVAAYIRRHPEYLDLIDPEFPRQAMT